MTLKNSNFINFFCLLGCFLFFSVGIRAEFPLSYVEYVNVMTGQLTDPRATATYEYYHAGTHQIAGKLIHLSADDFRIGRIKTIKGPHQQTISFNYGTDQTEVTNQSPIKNVYRYNSFHHLLALEQYSNETFYRSQEFYWKEAKPQPLLQSIVSIDQSGSAKKCTFFQYNSSGKVIRETLYGNLSGTCTAPLLIDPAGIPQDNGIENYSLFYHYSSSDPDLILSQLEDNGMITLFDYDITTKQCIAKLRGNDSTLMTRAFYSYDEKGFLLQTTVDDGQGKSVGDLTGVTKRQIIVTQASHIPSSLGQILVSTNKYLEIETGAEKLMNKSVYQYAKNGQLVEEDYYDTQDNPRYTIHYAYDDKGKLLSTVDSRGEIASTQENPIKKQYDQEGKVSASVDPLGNVTTYKYDSWGRLTETTYPFVLDENDQPVQLSQKHDYDTDDQITSIQDGAGHLTTTVFNARQKPISITYPDGSTERLIYFLDGELKEKILANGFITRYKRDSLTRIISKEELSPREQLLRIQTYRYQGSEINSITQDGVTKDFTYDGAGRQIECHVKSDSRTRRHAWKYNEYGQQTQVNEWFGPGEDDFVAKIDEWGNRQNKIAQRLEKFDGEIQVYQIERTENAKEYFFKLDQVVRNKLGQFVKLEEIIDIYGARNLKTYDALGRLENETQLNSLGEKMSEYSIRYNRCGQKAMETHLALAQGQQTHIFQIRWYYDALNRLTSIQEGVGTSLQKNTSYRYHFNGQIEAIIKPDGTVLFHRYNEDGTLAHFFASDHSFAYEYRYDDHFRPIEITDLLNTITQTRTYNDFNEIVEEHLGFKNLKLQNAFDLAGRRVELILPDASQILYNYEGALLESIQRRGEHSYTHRYTYNKPSGQLASNDLAGDSGVLSYAYDSNGRLLNISSPWWSEEIQTDEKPYDQVRSLTINDPKDKIQTHYTYGDDHQLTQEEGQLKKKYTYDSLHNRLSEGDNEWTTNEMNQLVHSHEAHFTYDTNGNTIRKNTDSGETHFVYDALNRLIQVTLSNRTLQYTYDAFNRQIRQQIYSKTGRLEKTEYFIYDGDKEIGKANEEGRITELRILGIGKGAEIGAAVALEFNRHVFIPLHDHQGSVRCLISMHDQSVAEFYRYTAYGTEEIYDKDHFLIEKSTVGNPWRFSSKRKDSDTGLIAFGKRFYDPSIGRWTSPDPLFFYDSPNLYTFVRNNPLNRYDLYGLFSISDTWNSAIRFFYDCALMTSNYFCESVSASYQLLEDVNSFDKIGKLILGDSLYNFGFHYAPSEEYGSVGDKEVSDKVRITYVNGVLTTRDSHLFNLDIISATHGGNKVHYVFRGTRGWSSDIIHAGNIKVGYHFGFKSEYTPQIVHLWRMMINEMGGVEKGGTIIHYAHSLGGTETDRAKDLLTSEEQKMIRVVTFGSPV